MGSAEDNPRYFLRSSGQSTPTLSLAESFWALQNRDLSISDSIERSIEDGVGYFEVGLRPERVEETRRLVSRFGLSLIAQGWVATVPEAIIYFQRAAGLNAVALNLQLGHAHMSSNEASDLFEQIRQYSQGLGILLLIETHRGRATQDLYRTAQGVRHCSGIAITLDISQYVVAGETLGGDEELFRQNLLPLLDRTALIHGRISDGQAIQVYVDASSEPAAEFFQTIWQKAMESWLADAPADAVFIFEPELGPVPYAFTTPSGEETFSRTEQSRVLISMARNAWASALATQRGERAPLNLLNVQHSDYSYRS